MATYYKIQLLSQVTQASKVTTIPVLFISIFYIYAKHCFPYTVTTTNHTALLYFSE